MKCEIIKDLLPVYCDGLASDATVEEVEKHLAECSNCKDVYENMKSAVPEIPKPDIQPMKKVRKTLRLRLALVIMIIAAVTFTGAYQLLCAHPMAAKSKNITVTHSSRCNDGSKAYIYKSNLISPGHTNQNSIIIPKDSEFVIDKENNCVWLNGKKAESGYNNDGTTYVPADGTLVPNGILCVNIKCSTPFNAIRYEYEHYPTMNTLLPAECRLTLRPCLPFRQDMQQCIYEDKVFRIELGASQCGKGAKLTIDCRDTDIVIDLHALAVEEGLLEE